MSSYINRCAHLAKTGYLGHMLFSSPPTDVVRPTLKQPSVFEGERNSIIDVCISASKFHLCLKNDVVIGEYMITLMLINY